MWKRSLLSTILLFVFVLAVQARGKVQGIAVYSQPATTAGLNSTNKFTRVLASATITVYTPSGTTNLAVLFSNAGGTSRANPFTAGSDGSYAFYTDAPAVDIRVSGVSGVPSFTISDVPVVNGQATFDIRTFGALCNGSQNDTTAITAANAAATSAGGSVQIPVGTCVTNSQAFSPTPLVFAPGGSLYINTGQTVTIQGPLVATPGLQIFKHATAGLGTVSFSGNPTLTEVWTEFWGAAPTSTATVNAAAFNAAALAITTIAGPGLNSAGLIRLGPGQYDFNSTWVLGATTGGAGGVGTFTGISIQGTNGLVGTVLNWTGSTSGTAIKVTRGRNNRFNDFFLTSGVASGTSVGLHLTGPVATEQTSGPTFTNVVIGNGGAFFDKGLAIGAAGGIAAGELTFINCTFQYNNTNIYGTGDGNTVVIRMVNTSCSHGAKAGVWMDAGSGGWHIAGGGFAANGTSGDATTGDILLNLGWNATVHIDGARFEIGNGTTDTFRGGIVNLGQFGIVNIDNCAVNSDGVPTAVPFIKGTGYWSVNGLSSYGDGSDGFILYNADGNAQGALTVRNSRISNSNTRTVPGGGVNTVALGIQFDPSNSGSQGMKIIAQNNFYSDISGVIIKHDNVEAIIGATPAASGKVFATRRVNANGQVTEDWLDLGDQDATPSVKWAKAFKYADTGATTQTAFDDMVDGEEIILFFTNGNRTIQNNASQKMAGGVDFVGTANDFLRVRKVGSVAIEVGRSVN